MTLVFGATTRCHRCRGSGYDRGDWCVFCHGTGLEPTAHARAGDPETSQAAAASISGERLRESQRVILDVLRTPFARAGLTDERIYFWVKDSGISPSGARTRRAELTRLGLVRDSGKRERLASGRMAIVWAAE